MKNLIILCFLVCVFQLSLSEVRAQSLPDSSMRKINAFRGFYENLGKVYPADSTITVRQAVIAGVTAYWFNKAKLSEKKLVVYYTVGYIPMVILMLTVRCFPICRNL